ncbi:MAG: HAMP domain-containing sensor histidine kinase [Gammaproteobacteria bacterium]|nr:HAMP domain-containing sensor histidine kinase [Gammaproteobacteria bacterium]
MENKLTLSVNNSNDDSLKHLISAIVHRIRTPLSSMAMGAGAIEEILPELFKSHKLAIEHNLIDSDIGENRLELLAAAFPNITHDINRTSEFLNDLLYYIDQLSVPVNQMPLIKASSWVAGLVKRSQIEPNLVQVDIQPDVEFRAPEVFANDLLANLLDNAARAIAKAGKGNIYISSATEQGRNTLYFKDTACGMTADQVNKIFSRYFSVRQEAFSAGLGFCRMGLMSTGVSIECESIEGEYTLYTLSFPQ